MPQNDEKMLKQGSFFGGWDLNTADMQNRDHQKLITHISLSLSNKGVDDDRFEETKEGKNRGGSFRDNHLEDQVSSSEHSVTETEDIFDKS